MPFDFKKEYKEFYLPPAKPVIVIVPKANYIAVRGKGDPNDENGAYQQAIGVLYAAAYTLKMSYKTGHHIEGFYDYVVPPLEGFWWQEGIGIHSDVIGKGFIAGGVEPVDFKQLVLVVIAAEPVAVIEDLAGIPGADAAQRYQGGAVGCVELEFGDFDIGFEPGKKGVGDDIHFVSS